MVGEVVVLVDEEIDFQASPISHGTQIVQLFHTAVLVAHLVLDAIGQKVGVSIAECAEASIAVRIQSTAVIAQFGIDDGKIKVDDEILVAVGRGVLPDIEVAVEPVEPVGGIDIIVVSEHRYGEALAESAGTDEEEVLVGIFHFLYEPCLVDIIAVVLAYGHKIHHSVGYALWCRLFSSIVHKLGAL